MSDYSDIEEDDLRNLLAEAEADGDLDAAEQYQVELDRRYGLDGYR